MTEKQPITVGELLNRMDNDAYIRHMSVHDNEGNRKYQKEYSKALKRDMKDLEGWCDREDFESYVEYINDRE